MNNREYKTPTLADQVFERLEADILMGKYQWGEVLTEQALAAELSVTPAMVRETLRRLKEEHLVEDAEGGVVALGLTRKDFEDMCAIRLRIESLAVRGFIENMTEDNLRELKEAVEDQKRFLAKNDKENLRAVDSHFHDTIYRNCGSMMFRDTLAPLHRKLRKFRKLSIDRLGRAEHSVAEHEAIYDAIAARDADRAEALMNTHIQNAMSVIIDKES